MDSEVREGSLSQRKGILRDERVCKRTTWSTIQCESRGTRQQPRHKMDVAQEARAQKRAEMTSAHRVAFVCRTVFLDERL
jgi:hypothetical protein